MPSNQDDKDPARILQTMADRETDWVDLRFTDPQGKWHHLTMARRAIGEDDLTEGLPFDGSSIQGWKAINESDMILRPDPDALYFDPFSATPMAILICDVIEPSTGEYYARDPRATARRAEAWLAASGIGDTVNVGAEAEFFMFDDVRFGTGYAGSSHAIDDVELPVNSPRQYQEGNLGHRPRPQGGYAPVAPIDSATDIRAEMLQTLIDMGLPGDKHHHEVAPAQHELGIEYASLLRAADHMQLQKYVVQMVAQAYGKTATFMPKPIAGDSGSGMHTHLSLWRDEQPLFAGEGYAGLSDTALYFIGGILRHARSLCAFTNPGTNSYKRLVPGHEAPVLLAYSSSNRSAACRIPYGLSTQAKRIEVRFPDPLANSYLAFSALLMAGLDGIENRIHPGDAMDRNLYDLPPMEQQQIPSLCRSLRESVTALQEDRNYLTRGDVFSNDQIDSYAALLMQDVERLEATPCPLEFELYYSR